MISQSLYTIFRDFIVDVLFEKSAEVRKIERMTTKEFQSTAQASSDPRALFSYKDPLVRALVWNIKFRKNPRCIVFAAKFLYEKASILEKTEVTMIIPVPLSVRRRRERGYNQIECITDQIELLDTRKIFEIRKDVLTRRHMPPQTSLSRHERLRNLKGVFVADKEKVRGRSIIVLDDVITTGATIDEISRTLYSAGALKVTVIAIAH